MIKDKWNIKTFREIENLLLRSQGRAPGSQHQARHGRHHPAGPLPRLRPRFSQQEDEEGTQEFQ